MSTVTRCTFWPYAGDYPYIDMEVNGMLSFMTLYNTLDYITPTGEPRIWPGGPEAAKEDGIDLAVKPWEFWLLIDGGRGEISCSDHSCHGYRFQVYDAKQDTQSSIQLTETEAVKIRKAVDAMIQEHADRFVQGHIGLYKPSHKVLAYPVKSRRFTHQPEAGCDTSILKSSRPKWPASQADIDKYRD